MACSITRPDPQNLFNRMRDMFSTTVLQGANVIPESNEWYVVSLNYAVAEEFYAFSEQQWKERDPRTACCENLVTLAAEDGVFPYAATFAQGYIKVSGTPGAAIPSPLEVTIGSGTYVSDGSVPSVMPPEAAVIVRVVAQSAGTQGNGIVGTTGTLTTPAPGIQSTVQVFGGFCGGEDEETCEQFRSRYLARKRFSPRATASWIEQKLLEWPCVTRVCRREGSCCTLSLTGQDCDCGGEFGYHVFMDNTFECGIPPECVIRDISEWMFGPEDQLGYGLGQAEVGVCGAVYQTFPVTINLEVSEYGCMSTAAKNEIRTRMAEFFKTLCPSVEIYANQIGSIVGSVIGFESTYHVEMSYAEDSAVTNLGDTCGGSIELECGYVACLGEIVFIDALPDEGSC